MKTWEMIKELTENPSKRFTYDTATKGSYITLEGVRPVWRGKGQCGQKLVVYIDRDWEEVKRPVSFMEAVASGKRMRVGSGDSYETLSRLLYILADKYEDEFIAYFLTTGEFYTED